MNKARKTVAKEGIKAEWKEKKRARKKYNGRKKYISKNEKKERKKERSITEERKKERKKKRPIETWALSSASSSFPDPSCCFLKCFLCFIRRFWNQVFTYKNYIYKIIIFYQNLEQFRSIDFLLLALISTLHNRF